MAPKTKPKKQIKKSLSVSDLSGKMSGRVGKPKTTKKLTSKPAKALIVIHGAGKFPRSNIEAVAADIKATYGKPLDTFVAYYADWDEKPMVNIAVQSTEALDFKQAFRSELQKRYDELPTSARPVVANVVADADSVGGIDMLGVLTKEITSYLFNPSVTQTIQAPFLQALKEASAYQEIIIVSHSMGTMVASDVLKQVADQYPVTTIITLGCPLAKLRNTGIRDDDLGKINEKTVRNWYNVFDTTDIVSDAISPSFPKPGYRIHDIFIEVADSMPAAHDYFNNAEAMRWITRVIG